MRMLRAGIDFELLELFAAEAAFRHHAPNGVQNHAFRMLLADDVRRLLTQTAHVAGVVLIDLSGVLTAGQHDLFRVDDDDEVTGIQMRGVDSLVTAAENVGDLNGKTTENLAFGIDNVPLAFNFIDFRKIGLLFPECYLRLYVNVF